MGDRLMDPKAQVVAEFIQRVRRPGVLPTPVESRRQLTRLIEVFETPAPRLARKENRKIPGPAGEIPVRLYVPNSAEGGLLPVLVYFHGGGWVQGDLDTHDTLCAKLSLGARCLVAAVDYRLAPEHRFPAAVDDCIAAYDWLCQNTDEWGGDKHRIAVAGDSAGGNLAAVVSQQAVPSGMPLPIAQLLIYPSLDFSFDTSSFKEMPDAFVIPRERMEWFRGHYLGDSADISDPRASPLRASDLSGQPATMIITGGFDPLRAEGRTYADRLRDAGVPVQYREFEGQIHLFVCVTRVISQGDICIDEMTTFLEERFITTRGIAA
ncbi:MAG TPA: alpha/beta hydrolase [Gammaproteobacteria bacterium]|nr:alpha/beta hydrolase [Gammaproteobacteria bacterium]